MDDFRILTGDEKIAAARRMGPLGPLTFEAMGDFPPEPETMTEIRARCVMLDEYGDAPPGERLFNVREVPNPFRVGGAS